MKLSRQIFFERFDYLGKTRTRNFVLKLLTRSLIYCVKTFVIPYFIKIIYRLKNMLKKIESFELSLPETVFR